MAMNDTILLHARTQSLIDKLLGAIPQALVIDGPSGSGVVTVAKHLADSMGTTGYVITPKKSVNGQMVADDRDGQVIIDDIRQLYEQTRTKQDGAQVYIIDTGERSMTVAAQNAFLKLLEEPRACVHFIIATHHYDQLLPTIASRSQRLSLLPINDRQSMQLIDQLGITDSTKRTRLAFVGQGLPALIKRLAADEKAYEARVAVMSDAKTLITGSAYEKVTVINKYREDRAGALMLLDDMNHQLRVIINSKPDISLAKAIDRHLETRRHILANGNIRLQLAADVL